MRLVTATAVVCLAAGCAIAAPLDDGLAKRDNGLASVNSKPSPFKLSNLARRHDGAHVPAGKLGKRNINLGGGSGDSTNSGDDWEERGNDDWENRENRPSPPNVDGFPDPNEEGDSTLRPGLIPLDRLQEMRQNTGLSSEGDSLQGSSLGGVGSDSLGSESDTLIPEDPTFDMSDLTAAERRFMRDLPVVLKEMRSGESNSYTVARKLADAGVDADVIVRIAGAYSTFKDKMSPEEQARFEQMDAMEAAAMEESLAGGLEGSPEDSFAGAPVPESLRGSDSVSPAERIPEDIPSGRESTVPGSRPGVTLPGQEDSLSGSRPGVTLPSQEDSLSGSRPGAGLPNQEDSLSGSRPGVGLPSQDDTLAGQEDVSQQTGGKRTMKQRASEAWDYFYRMLAEEDNDRNT